MTLSTLTTAFQQQLELLRLYESRGDDDDKVREQLEEDLEKARAALWSAWLERGMEAA